MPDPRPWPNNAKEARDKAAEAAVRGVRTLDPLVEAERLNPADQAKVTKAWGLFHFIARILEGEGAQTKP